MIGATHEPESVGSDVVITAVAGDLRGHGRTGLTVDAANAYARAWSAAVSDPDRLVNLVGASIRRDPNLATRSRARDKAVEVVEVRGVVPVAALTVTVRRHVEYTRARRSGARSSHRQSSK